MKIQLLGWESRGLRCPDLNIDFTIGGRVPKVGLLQMPNGVGKTTTLACLRAALDGSATDWNAGPGSEVNTGAVAPASVAPSLHTINGLSAAHAMWAASMRRCGWDIPSNMQTMALQLGTS